MSDKQFGVFTAEVKEAANQDRVLQFMGTTGVRDRMGDEIPVKGWNFENYMKAGAPVLWGHKYDEPPIGRTLQIQRKTVNGVKGWVFDVEFDTHPKADMIFGCCKRGFLKSVSVGFRSLASDWIEEDEEESKQREKDAPDDKPGKIFKKKELLELSLTPVPANPEALMVARKKGLEVPTEVADKLDQWALERASDAVANTKRIKDQLKTEDNNQPYVMTDADEAWSHVDPATGIEFTNIGGFFDESSFEDKDLEDSAVTKPGWDETEGEIKYRVRDPGKFQDGSFRRVTLQKQKPRVIAVMGKLTGQDTMTIQSLAFPKGDGWKLHVAKKWVEDHPDVVKALQEMPEYLFRVIEEVETIATDVAQPDERTAETLSEEESAQTSSDDSARSSGTGLAETTSEAGGPEHICKYIFRKAKEKVFRIKKGR